MRNSVKIALSVVLIVIAAQFPLGVGALADHHDRDWWGIAIIMEIVTMRSVAPLGRLPAPDYPFSLLAMASIGSSGAAGRLNKISKSKSKKPEGTFSVSRGSGIG
jgi:hypothetical protein